MNTNFPGLEKFLAINKISNANDILQMVYTDIENNAISVSQIRHKIYGFLENIGFEESNIICLADEMIDWIIDEMPETQENINKIVEFAIDNDMHPSAIDRLTRCDLSCLVENVRKAIERN
jgi:hypothetical protein